MDWLLFIIGTLWTAASLIAATIILIQGTQPSRRARFRHHGRRREPHTGPHA
jgi:hypothetical protein